MTSFLSTAAGVSVQGTPVSGRGGIAHRRVRGFGLIELMITVLIIAVLAAIAFPQYMRYTIKSKRVAAEACLASYANYMERYYTTYLRYDQSGSGSSATANSLSAASLDCNAQTAANYYYKFDTGQPTATAFKILAIPQAGSIQATKDTVCATVSLDQTGARGVSGTGTVSQCW